MAPPEVDPWLLCGATQTSLALATSRFPHLLGLGATGKHIPLRGVNAGDITT